MQKESRVSDKAMLDVSGRDIQDQRLYLARDEESINDNNNPDTIIIMLLLEKNQTFFTKNISIS